MPRGVVPQTVTSQANVSPRERSPPARIVPLAALSLRERVEEVLNPALGRPFWETDRSQAEGRGASHGGDVAEAAREGFSGYVRGFVGFAEEVDAFYKEVRGEEQIVGAAAGTVDGAVVADAGYEGG